MQNTTIYHELNGLTKREYVATAILQGLVGKYTMNKPEDQITLSQLSVELADTFLKHLNNTEIDEN